MKRRTEGAVLRTKTAVRLLLLWLAAIAFLPAGASAQQPSNSSGDSAVQPPLTAEEIVSRLQARNHEREVALRQFHGQRIYSVRYTGFFGTHAAEAVVEFKYTAPRAMEFQVISQTGSKFVVDHVILKLLEAESEAATEQNRRRTALNSDNYNFTLTGYDTTAPSPQYILSVSPKNDSKFLYRGKIWVDAGDFAVTRIDAEPAKSPSIWIKETEVRHRYEKIGGFWLPAENESESSMRMGGRALLSIKYSDYQITELTQLSAHASPAASDPLRGRPTE